MRYPATWARDQSLRKAVSKPAESLGFAFLALRMASATYREMFDSLVCDSHQVRLLKSRFFLPARVAVPFRAWPRVFLSRLPHSRRA